MILYLDSSALVKRYVSERGTEEVAEAIAVAQMVGTAEVSRAETSATLAKAIRVGVLKRERAEEARESFHQDWPAMVRVQVSESVVARADDLAWDLGLRGYDAVQLACAAGWREGMDAEIVLATFDQRLWEAAVRRNFIVFPESLAPYVKNMSQRSTRRSSDEGWRLPAG